MEKLPSMIKTAINIDEPNENIVIYKGVINLVSDQTTYQLDGVAQFYWYPHIGPQITGTLIGVSLIGPEFTSSDRTFDVVINSTFFGQGKIIQTYQSTHAAPWVRIDIMDQAVLGDRSIAVSKVTFAIPNLRPLGGGELVQDGSAWSRNRIVFEDESFNITIDLRSKYRDLAQKLEASSGYVTLYNGELINKKGHLYLSDVTTLLYSFSLFLSMINGRRCSPLFIQGIHDDEVLWTDFTGYQNRPYKWVFTWPEKHSIKGLSQLWSQFQTLWRNGENDQDFLSTAVHWYAEANGNSGLVEGSIIMIQTALELIYNWLLVERKKLLVGADAVNLSAANKIRLLLSELFVEFQLPDKFSDLLDVEAFDGPDALVQIRNAIVHGQEDKRRKLSKISGSAKAQALQLGIWYVELSLLYILKFEGLYVDRSGKDNFMKSTLPWREKK